MMQDSDDAPYVKGIGGLRRFSNLTCPRGREVENSEGVRTLIFPTEKPSRCEGGVDKEGISDCVNQTSVTDRTKVSG